MYYVNENKDKKKFERMDEAVDYARQKSKLRKQSICVENSNKNIMCYIEKGEVTWTKKAYTYYYNELKKGEK